MKTLIAILPLADSLSAADAPFTTPEAIIEQLYKSDPPVFNPSEDIELTKRYLGKNLIALLVREAERSRTEVGAIDFHIPTARKSCSPL
jgi:hypothetical protein